MIELRPTAEVIYFFPSSATQTRRAAASHRTMGFIPHCKLLPSVLLAGIPGKPGTQTGLGAPTSTASPPTGLLGVALGGDNSPRMVAIQALVEF